MSTTGAKNRYPPDTADVEGLLETLQQAGLGGWWSEHRNRLPEIVQEAIHTYWNIRRWSSWEEFHGHSYFKEGVKHTPRQGLREKYLQGIVTAIHLAKIEENTQIPMVVTENEKADLLYA